jgi:hypothetical protein
MPSSAMLRRVALVRANVSEERSASIIRVERISELETTLVATSNRTITVVPSSAILVTLIRNIDSYKSHATLTPQKMGFLIFLISSPFRFFHLLPRMDFFRKLLYAFVVCPHPGIATMYSASERPALCGGQTLHTRHHLVK